MKSVLSRVDKSGRGVTVQASTLGSLEALLEFLRVSKIPVAAVGIGPVHRREVMRASIMLEHETEYATILAFDVKVTDEATKEALSLGVNIFSAKIM
jgi:translation initiation factor 5B